MNIPYQPAKYYFQQAAKWINKHAIILMLTASIIYFIFVGTLSILDHVGLRTQLNDLGHMEQAIWQVTQGNFSMPLSTPRINTSRFAQHANVIFYFIAPLYALFPHPITLLLLGTAAVSIAGFLLFWLSKLILKNNFIALIFGLSFLLNPLVQETNLYDFHPIVLAFPLFLAIIIFQEQKKWKSYWVCLLLLMFVKENMPSLAIMIGIYVILRSSKVQGILSNLSAIIYWTTLQHITPLLVNIPLNEFTWSRFSYLGDSPVQIIITVIKNPLIILALLASPFKIQYLSYIFLQGGFLAIFSPSAVLWTIPNIAQNFLSSPSSHFQDRITGVYYSGIVITTTYAAAVYGLRTLQYYQPKWVKRFIIVFTLQAILISIIMSPTPYGLLVTWKNFYINYNRQTFKNISDLIPPDASLSTQNNVGAHFASRQTIVKYPQNTKNVDFILLHIKDPTHYDNGLFIRNAGMTLFGTSSGLNISKYYKKLVDKAFNESDFGVLTYSSPWYLLKRGHDQSLNNEAHQTALIDISELCLDITRDKQEYKTIVDATWFHPNKQSTPTNQTADEYCEAYFPAPLQ